MSDKRLDIVKETTRQAIREILHPMSPSMRRFSREEPLSLRARIALQLEAMVALAELRLELARDLVAYTRMLSDDERKSLGDTTTTYGQPLMWLDTLEVK